MDGNAVAALASSLFRRTTKAAHTAEFGGLGPINAAFAYEALGNEDEADAAYRHSLLIHRITALATDWPRAIEIRDATTAEDLGALVEAPAQAAPEEVFEQPVEVLRQAQPRRVVRGLEVHGLLERLLGGGIVEDDDLLGGDPFRRLGGVAYLGLHLLDAVARDSVEHHDTGEGHREPPGWIGPTPYRCELQNVHGRYRER